jgi:hypothetical protein
MKYFSVYAYGLFSPHAYVRVCISGYEYESKKYFEEESLAEMYSALCANMFNRLYAHPGTHTNYIGVWVLE